MVVRETGSLNRCDLNLSRQKVMSDFRTNGYLASFRDSIKAKMRRLLTYFNLPYFYVSQMTSRLILTVE
jgi:hypothetical protein